MNVLQMAWLELRRRHQGALLSLLLVTSVTAILTAVWTLRDATTQRIRRVTAQIGNNLLFLPEDADPGAYFSVAGEQPLMDDAIADRLYHHPVTGHHGTHYVARLQQRGSIGAVEAILTGFRVIKGGHRPGEDRQRRRSFLDDPLPAGSVLVGSEIARRLNVAAGEVIHIQGRPFTIHRVIHELGDLDDLRIWGRLEEFQQVLDRAGQVHAVDALGCWGDGSYLAPIREAVEQDPELAGLRLLHTDQIARTRIRTRMAVERVGALTALIVAGLAALGLFVTTLFEVRTRRGEIGILGALGAGAGRIALLFVPKALAIGFLFQSFHLVTYLTAEENVRAALTIKGQDADEAAALLERVGLDERRDHLCDELSVGERQRVALARAMAGRPPLLLADEPTGNLDPANADIVINHLRRYADEGAAVVVVTHDSVLRDRAHRVLRIRGGCLV